MMVRASERGWLRWASARWAHERRDLFGCLMGRRVVDGRDRLPVKHPRRGTPPTVTHPVLWLVSSAVVRHAVTVY